MSKKKSTETYENKVIKALNEEVLRRDKIIDELRKENEILLKLSIKRSEALEDTMHRVKKKTK